MKQIILLTAPILLLFKDKGIPETDTSFLEMCKEFLPYLISIFILLTLIKSLANLLYRYYLLVISETEQECSSDFKKKEGNSDVK